MEKIVSLKELSDAAPIGPWGYRPDNFDDWGLIRGGEIESDHIGLIKPPVAIAHRGWFDRDDDANRALGRDPCEATAQFIVHLVNAYRNGELVEKEATP